jgi:hypothetical protein
VRRLHPWCVLVLLLGCGGLPLRPDAGSLNDAGQALVDAGPPFDAGARDAGVFDAGVVDAGTIDAGVTPCSSCPDGAFCSSAGVCDYACGSCQSDVECGPRHRCWFGSCIDHQPDCTDARPLIGVRLEVDMCSALGSEPLCQRVLEVPFDGGLATIRREPIGSGDGGTFVTHRAPSDVLRASFLDAGLSCVEARRLEVLSPACITHSTEVRVITTTTTGVSRFSWWFSAATRPPRAVEMVVRDGFRFVDDVLTDAGVR